MLSNEVFCAMLFFINIWMFDQILYKSAGSMPHDSDSLHSEKLIMLLSELDENSRFTRGPVGSMCFVQKKCVVKIP